MCTVYIHLHNVWLYCSEVDMKLSIMSQINRIGKLLKMSADYCTLCAVDNNNDFINSTNYYHACE